MITKLIPVDIRDLTQNLCDMNCECDRILKGFRMVVVICWSVMTHFHPELML
jgi:hypothetical protein